MELDKFKHKYRLRVRNFEVDSQGIVHNAIYLEYCEIGRVEYVRQLGFKLLPGGIFESGFKVMVKKNEITYESPAKLDDVIDVYTRVSYIKNSSFCFEHIILNAESGEVICSQRSVQVNLNSESGRPERLADSYRKLISDFEGNSLEILN